MALLGFTLPPDSGEKRTLGGPLIIFLCEIVNIVFFYLDGVEYYLFNFLASRLEFNFTFCQVLLDDSFCLFRMNFMHQNFNVLN